MRQILFLAICNHDHKFMRSLSVLVVYLSCFYKLCIHFFANLLTGSMNSISWSTGCPKGLYGKYCNKKCNCANNGRCHRTYGACLCDPGLYGRFCHLRELHVSRHQLLSFLSLPRMPPPTSCHILSLWLLPLQCLAVPGWRSVSSRPNLFTQDTHGSFDGFYGESLLSCSLCFLSVPLHSNH